MRDSSRQKKKAQKKTQEEWPGCICKILMEFLKSLKQTETWKPYESRIPHLKNARVATYHILRNMRFHKANCPRPELRRERFGPDANLGKVVIEMQQYCLYILRKAKVQHETVGILITSYARKVTFMSILILWNNLQHTYHIL